MKDFREMSKAWHLFLINENGPDSRGTTVLNDVRARWEANLRDYRQQCRTLMLTDAGFREDFDNLTLLKLFNVSLTFLSGSLSLAMGDDFLVKFRRTRNRITMIFMKLNNPNNESRNYSMLVDRIIQTNRSIIDKEFDDPMNIIET